jgi:hypothetical protein
LIDFIAMGSIPTLIDLTASDDNDVAGHAVCIERIPGEAIDDVSDQLVNQHILNCTGMVDGRQSAVDRVRSKLEHMNVTELRSTSLSIGAPSKVANNILSKSELVNQLIEKLKLFIGDDGEVTEHNWLKLNRRIVSIDIGLRNIAYADIDVSTMRINDWRRVDLGIGCGGIGVITPLVVQFAETLQIDKGTRILIEEQRTRTAGGPMIQTVFRANMVSAQLFAMFFSKAQLMPPKAISAASGIKEKASQSTSGSRYLVKKRTAITVARGYINDGVFEIDRRLKSYFECEKKKDDLADALVQANIYMVWKRNAVDLLNRLLVV